MPAWAWILITVVAVVAAVASIVWLLSKQRKREALQGRFGPEYDRTVRERDSRRAAESELQDRERRREELDIRPLAPLARARYADEWGRPGEVRRRPQHRRPRCERPRAARDGRPRIPDGGVRAAGGRHLGGPPRRRRKLSSRVPDRGARRGRASRYRGPPPPWSTTGRCSRSCSAKRRASRESHSSELARRHGRRKRGPSAGRDVAEPALVHARVDPAQRASDEWSPRSTMRPASNTSTSSAPSAVERRCAIVTVVRPASSRSRA